MARKLGSVKIKVDGTVLESKPGASLDPGGTERATVMGDNEVLGFSQQPKQSKVDCEIVYGKETSLSELGEIEDATLSFECDTGQTYVVQGAWLTNTPALKGGEGGSVQLTFEGPPAEEMK